MKTLHSDRILNSLWVLFCVALVSACGGGGNSQDTSSGGTGSVGIMLTDAPADPELFSAINATIERIELIGGDAGRVEIFDGPAETVDLLSLRNESMPFAFQDSVPAGSYCKIRLTLANPDGLELVLAEDGTSHYPKLPGNGKLDLQTRGCFTLTEGGSITLQLDLDAGNSIHIVKRGNRDVFNFRPVVFVDVLDAEFTGRLVRVDGVIAGVDDDTDSLLLCDALPAGQDDDRDCVKVFLGADSAFFVNTDPAYQGDARPLDELLNEGNVGNSASVVGLHRSFDYPDEDIDIPSDVFPPSGECRVWLTGVEPVDQPEAVLCNELEASLPVDAVLIDEEGVIIRDHRPRMALDGLAVEMGDFSQIEGAVASDADTQGFTMTTEAAELLAVELQDPVGYNGTRIITKHGELLDYTAITVPRLLQVDGVRQPATDSLKAAVVIVDTANAGQAAAEGSVASVETGGFILIPEAGSTPCGLVGDLFVTLADSANVTTVIIMDDTVDITPDGVVETGRTVGVKGVCEAGGLTANHLVIVDDRRL
ncbi:MAG: DUF4382 domain-containing protein [Candidatus Thiodiazotropha sp. (ex Dulcina madagascariensis)]|nr:DUF4382 domain-containing protein [Candidatus Thiodiazotropha sp. (ex Dulcina madagascariensis)]